MAGVFFIKPSKMGPIIVNIIASEFKLYQQGLNEFVHPGHKGLIR